MLIFHSYVSLPSLPEGGNWDELPSTIEHHIQIKSPATRYWIYSFSWDPLRILYIVMDILDLAAGCRHGGLEDDSRGACFSPRKRREQIPKPDMRQREEYLRLRGISYIYIVMFIKVAVLVQLMLSFVESLSIVCLRV